MLSTPETCRFSIEMKLSVVRIIFLSVCLRSVSSASQAHIIFVVADDLGWNDVGFRNPQMITPRIDSFAKAGVILNSSYVQPVCTPSRNCFMTGYYPYHTGLQDGVIGATRAKYIPSNFTLLPQKLQELGYVTHMIGKWHLGYCNWKYTPTFRGFDSFLGFYNGGVDYYMRNRTDSGYSGFDFRFNTSVYKQEEGVYSTYVFAKRAIDIIKSHDKTKPLYLYLPFQSVHTPMQVPEKYEKMYSHIQTEDRRLYCGMVTAMDEAFGNITDALEKYGFMDNLLLVFTTDNGGPVYVDSNNLPLRGGKMTLWEGGTKGTGFIYSKTLLNKTGYTNTGMMHAVDWFPTLLFLAGGQPDSHMDGINQWKMLSTGAPSLRNEFVYNIRSEHRSAIRYGHYKLIQGTPGAFNTWYPLPTLEKKYDVMNSDHYKWPEYQLFNITADPTEHFDIADKYPQILQDMKNRLAKWRQSKVPAQRASSDPKANPKYFNGAWSPGWC